MFLSKLSTCYPPKELFLFLNCISQQLSPNWGGETHEGSSNGCSLPEAIKYLENALLFRGVSSDIQRLLTREASSAELDRLVQGFKID